MVTTLLQRSSLSTAPNVDELVTGEELKAMSDIGRAELVKGRIIPLMPTGHPHSYFEAMIAALLFNFVRLKKIGRVLTGEVGIYTHRNPDTVRAADAAFISNERFAQVRSHSYLDVCPELIVEVLSPDDSWSMVQEKLEEYFTVGAQVIWVLDPRLEQVHVYESLDNVTRLTKKDVLIGRDLLSGFTVPLNEIFTED
ncbi:MAG: Uma2 family endonuclease [Caldilineaceae bacterium]